MCTGLNAPKSGSLKLGSPVRFARNPTRHVVPPSKPSPVSTGAAPLRELRRSQLWRKWTVGMAS